MKDYRYRPNESTNKQKESRAKKQQLAKSSFNYPKNQREALTEDKLFRSQQLPIYEYQTDAASILQVFSTFYFGVERQFKEILVAMTKLQAKIADCYGKFNKIEWKLTKQVHEISQSKMLNSELVNMNKQIENQLQRVKIDYQQLKKRKYISNMQKKIDQLKEFVHKIEIQQYKNKFNKHQHIIFQDNIDRLEQVLNKNSQRKDYTLQREIYNDIIKNLVVLLKGKSDAGKWIQQKLQENIQMKFKLLKYQSTS